MNHRKIGALDYIAYALSAVVYILPQYLLSSFLSAYYTDVALVSAGTIGMVVLAMRFTDGISDLLMGRVIDKTNTRFGKARPWLLVGTIGLTISLISIFNVPRNMSNGVKIAWLAVTYFFIMTIFGTVQGVASNTMIVYLTKDSGERNKFGASNMAGVYIGGLAATAVASVLLSKLGYTQSGYSKTMFLYSAIVLVVGTLSFIRLKEFQADTDKIEQPKVPLKAVLYAIRHNSYYINAVIAGLLINLINGITTGMGVYFCRDLFGNPEIYAMVTIALLAPTLLGLPIAVAIANEVGHQKTLVYGRIGYMIGVAIQASGLINSNIPVYFVGVLFAGLCGSTFAACFTARLANICDYGVYKFKINASGTLMSATSFCNKIGLGLGATVTGFILELAHYDGSLVSAGIAQSAYTIGFERYAVAFIPLVLNMIVVICLSFTNVDPKLEQMKAELLKRGEK